MPSSADKARQEMIRRLKTAHIRQDMDMAEEHERKVSTSRLARQMSISAAAAIARGRNAYREDHGSITKS